MRAKSPCRCLGMRPSLCAGTAWSPLGPSCVITLKEPGAQQAAEFGGAWGELGRGPESLGVGRVYCQQDRLQGTVRPGETPNLAHLLSTPPSTAPWVPTPLRSGFSLVLQALPRG